MLTSLHRFGFLVRWTRLLQLIERACALNHRDRDVRLSSVHLLHNNHTNTPYLIHPVILDTKLPSKSF